MWRKMGESQVERGEAEPNANVDHGVDKEADEKYWNANRGLGTRLGNFCDSPTPVIGKLRRLVTLTVSVAPGCLTDASTCVTTGTGQTLIT
jgi:hypothetical protein